MGESVVVDGCAVVERQRSDQFQVGEVGQGFVREGGTACEVEPHGELEELGQHGHVVVGYTDVMTETAVVVVM